MHLLEYIAFFADLLDYLELVDHLLISMAYGQVLDVYKHLVHWDIVAAADFKFEFNCLY